MAKIEERVASLETGMKVIRWVGGIAIPLVIAGAVWVGTNLIAIKQKLADGGNAPLVVSIERPSSLEQLAANLGLVASRVRVARVEGKKPNMEKLRPLDLAVSEAARHHPDVPEVWNAAAELVSYRTPVSGPSLKPCAQNGEETIYSQPRFVDPKFMPVLDTTFIWHDCEMILDDNPILNDSIVVKEFQGGVSRAVIVLKNVQVVYRGGKVPEFDQIVLQNCSFDFTIPTTPAVPIRKIAEGLLIAQSNENIRIEITGRGQPG